VRPKYLAETHSANSKRIHSCAASQTGWHGPPAGRRVLLRCARCASVICGNIYVRSRRPTAGAAIVCLGAGAPFGVRYVSRQQDQVAEAHKRSVALSSVLAAVFLTLIKVVVGLLTGSLGILAEAAHSGLDLVAALVTYLAVRISGAPADLEHPYGHGKVENLSALFETLLLLGTCAWIISEAIRRLIAHRAAVDANVWAFAIMFTSVAVNIVNSRRLSRAAKLHDSQALEADALHFSTDVWSSMVVIVGLAFVRVGQLVPGLSFLREADSIAALGVALIVLYVSTQLGRRTISVLLDTAPADVSAEIAEGIRRLPDVRDVHQVRVRRAGPDSFVDLSLVVRPEASLEKAHGIASQVEGLVQSLLPRADVVVHVEPSSSHREDESVVADLHAAARALDLDVHGIRTIEVGDQHHIEVHAELPPSLSLAQAHEIISRFEQDVREHVAGVSDIITHIEPAGQEPALTASSVSADRARALAHEAQSLAESMFGAQSCHKVQVHTIDGRPSVSMHCVLPAEMSLDRAHELSESLEDALRLRYPPLDRVLIHTEPLVG
jgi:cation diffusion facilitator family transporter